MKMKWLGAMVLLLAVAGMVGCSSDSEASGGAGLASCNAYCDAAMTAKCAGAADCKTDECGELGKATGACDTAFKTYYDCLKAQSNVCSDGCTLDISKCT